MTADLLIYNARLVATVDADRQELPGGWVTITNGLFQVSEHLPMQCLKHHNALMRAVA